MNTLERVADGASSGSGFTFQLLACRPNSRGSVRLRDADPASKPAIEGLYFSGPDGADLATLREGVKLARKICKARAFDECRGEEVFPGTAVRSDEDIEQYVRSSVHSANALTGTCRMGRADDPLAVLDSELRVRGIEALRVVDASAMPQVEVNFLDFSFLLCFFTCFGCGGVGIRAAVVGGPLWKSPSSSVV